MKQLEDNVLLWSTGIEASRVVRSFDLHPEDSVSNVESRHESVTSRKSVSRSTVSDDRAKATAKRAILEAEAATLKRLHQIEEEELKLRQRKNELKLETEMAKARAEEIAFSQAVEQERAAREVQIRENQPAKSHATAGLNEGHASCRNSSMKDSAIPDLRNTSGQPDRNSSSAEKQSRLYTPRHNALAGFPITNQHQLSAEAPEWRYEGSMQPDCDVVVSSTPQAPLASDQNKHIQLLLQQQKEAIMALTLPQPDLPVFGGDPIEYCDFIRAFETSSKERRVAQALGSIT